MREVVLFPTGWAAGFAAITALVREADHVLLDARAHASLQQAARAATRQVSFVRHLDVEDARAKLRAIRSIDVRNGILVVTEGLFSMDADTPDLVTLQETCREYNATLLIDVAHDFGATGPRGTGSLGACGLLGRADLVMGSFSKTFATNGGFVATQLPAVKQFVKYFGGPHIFSTALSPIQAAAARAALSIVRSMEGDVLREALAAAARSLRERCKLNGLTCAGAPSPIVPVLTRNAKTARIASRLLADSGVLANLVEYPAVPIKATRFRFQVMASHTQEECEAAADTLANCLRRAEEVLRGFDRHLLNATDTRVFSDSR